MACLKKSLESLSILVLFSLVYSGLRHLNISSIYYPAMSCVNHAAWLPWKPFWKMGVQTSFWKMNQMSPNKQGYTHVRKRERSTSGWRVLGVQAPAWEMTQTQKALAVGVVVCSPPPLPHHLSWKHFMAYGGKRIHSVHSLHSRRFTLGEAELKIIIQGDSGNLEGEVSLAISATVEETCTISQGPVESLVKTSASIKEAALPLTLKRIYYLWQGKIQEFLASGDAALGP